MTHNDNIEEKETRPICLISMVGTDANDYQGKGIPRKTFSIFDVKSELELEEYEAIVFISIQDLLEYYREQTGQDGSHLNGYQLAYFLIERNLKVRYMMDEVPLIKFGGWTYIIFIEGRSLIAHIWYTFISK